MTIDVYNKQNKSNSSSEILEGLNKFERYCVSILSRVEIRGEKGRKVPVLLLGKVEHGIDLLINTREAGGIEKGNGFSRIRPRKHYLKLDLVSI